ncbi:hypothetical protein Pst134EB_020070 [Puccinia striiformis f. sp. tritici]|nr:hypothetical protein Pst134EB_020070 [Puccinia striiformis f. sp. tritici]
MATEGFYSLPADKPSHYFFAHNNVFKLLILLLTINFCSANFANGFDIEKRSDPYDHPENVTLDDWVKGQVNKSWSILMSNVSPQGALPGLIVASLTTGHPNYFFSWTRDTAVVLKEIISRYEETNDPNLLAIIKQTISATQVIQKGSFNAEANMGEPKYEVNGQPFTGNWYRPQNDGPALRATVYMKFARIYLKVGGIEALEYVERVLYNSNNVTSSVIKIDLEYISKNWRQISFDLWEEVKGHHFFTYSVTQRALKEGAQFCQEIKDQKASSWYQQQADEVGEQLKLFWDDQKKFVVDSRDELWVYYGKTSGLDVGTILGCLHSGRYVSEDFQPGSYKMTNTFKAMLNSMSSLYPLNQRYEHYAAKAIGRYPEDIYDGENKTHGNPWFITTLAMSEYLYRTNSVNLFKNETGFETRQIADQFLMIVKDSVQTNGSIHEGFSRIDGHGVGARDLTWSHVAFLSMERARRGLPEF